MKKLAIFAISVLILLTFFVAETFACTTFCLKNKGDVIFGKNYDWMIGDGLIFVNKRGVSKTATAEMSEDPAKWVSKYGSVTFNQYGRENPSGGMNEVGLVIELMWLDDTQYPKPDSRPTIGTLEWIQYNLDNFGTVAEVVENADKIRIASEVKLHYLINDVHGNSAAIEFLDGKLITHTGDKLPVSALANDTYEKSWAYAREVDGFGGKKAVPQTAGSFDRFTRAAQKTKEFEKQNRTRQEAIDYAFDVLANVAQKDYTQWSIVYNQKKREIYFRSLQSPQIKKIDIKAFDYGCGGAVKIFDINSKTGGDISRKFADYTRQANRDLIERSFNGTDFLRGTPVAFRDLAASYPENFACEVKYQKAEQKAEADGTFGSFLSYCAQSLLDWINKLFV